MARHTLQSVGLNDRSPQDLLGRTSVSAASNADILVFAVTDPSPSVAIRLVNGYAHQFIRFSEALDTASVRAALDGVDARIHDLKRTVVTGGSSDPALASELRILLSRQQDLQTLEQLQGGKLRVLSPASGTSRTQPLTARNTMVGAALGLVLGIALAFLADSLDTRVRGADEVSAILRLGLIGRVPTPLGSLSKRFKLAMLEPGKPTRAEPYRNLRTGFDLANLTVQAKTVLVTSAVQREGKSTTSANLAVAVAHRAGTSRAAGPRPAAPVDREIFGLEGREGVTTVASGAAALQDALAAVAIAPGRSEAPEVSGNGAGSYRAEGLLEVLPSGPVPPDPAEFLTTEALASIIGQLRERCDLVLIDSPPALAVGDAMALSSIVDAVLIVARAGIVRRGALSEMRRRLDTTPAAKLGFVLTGADVEDGYGDMGEYGYYGAGVEGESHRSLKVPRVPRGHDR